MITFYFVHEVVRYNAKAGRVSEILPGIWEEASLLDRLGQERLDELAQHPRLVERIAS